MNFNKIGGVFKNMREHATNIAKDLSQETKAIKNQELNKIKKQSPELYGLVKEEMEDIKVDDSDSNQEKSFLTIGDNDPIEVFDFKFSSNNKNTEEQSEIKMYNGFFEKTIKSLGEKYELLHIDNDKLAIEIKIDCDRFKENYVEVGVLKHLIKFPKNYQYKIWKRLMFYSTTGFPCQRITVGFYETMLKLIISDEKIPLEVYKDFVDIVLKQ